MSVQEAATELQVPERTVRLWCQTGALKTKPKRRPKAAYRVVRSDVERVKRERERG
jgi:predicted site-specific integrase-resolvase